MKTGGEGKGFRWNKTQAFFMSSFLPVFLLKKGGGNLKANRS
jgi:hypothetical protein